MVASTTADRWERLHSVLATVLEAAPEVRDAMLQELLPDDEALRCEARRLLGHEAAADQLFERPPFPLTGTSEGGLTGRLVGGYRVLQRIDQGGMGEVYLAARADDFEQRVALKVVREGLVSRDLILRFENERQLLASIEHPNIARLLGGGATEDGLPFLLMEHVEGLPIDRFCDRQALGTDERVRIFLKVCSAVEALHRNLIVHRDLKPTNILVSDNGEPKLLDFGIAKLLEPRGPVHPNLTELGTPLPMTLLYASPEQVGGGSVATPSDVYSLGVLLYKLLTDRVPYQADLDERDGLVRAILEQDPVRPSAVSAKGTTSRRPRASSDGNRPADDETVASPVRKLGRDLDSIVLKALQKEPEHRYGSVEQMAADLRRYLDGFPVVAREGGLAYRAAKLVRRKRWALLSGTAIAALLLFGLDQWRQKGIERERTLREQERVEAVSDFLETIIKAAQPDRAKGAPVSLRDVLLEKREEFLQQVEEAPAFQADLASSLGETYGELGLLDESRDFFERAVALWREELGGADHPGLAKDLNNLGAAWLELGDAAQAERFFGDSIDMRRRLETPVVDLIIATNNQAAAFTEKGELARAEELYRRTLAIREQAFGPDSTEAGIGLYNLGAVFYNAGRFAEAEKHLRRSLEVLLTRLEPDDPKVGFTQSTLGRVLLSQGRLSEAETVFRNLLVDRRRLYGEEHFDVALTRRDLAAVLVRQGRAADALHLAQQALTSLLASSPGHKFRLASTDSVIGECLMKQGRFAEVEPRLVASYETLVAERGERSTYTREALRRVIELYDAWGLPDRAAEYRAKLTP